MATRRCLFCRDPRLGSTPEHFKIERGKLAHMRPCLPPVHQSIQGFCSSYLIIQRCFATTVGLKPILSISHTRGENVKKWKRRWAHEPRTWDTAKANEQTKFLPGLGHATCSHEMRVEQICVDPISGTRMETGARRRRIR
jgi:hypothetical protein